MAYEKRDNSGALFKNDKKAKDTHPDYKGMATVDGVDYEIGAWVKKSKAGASYMSLSFKVKEAADLRQAPTPARTAAHVPAVDESEDLPF